MVDSSHLVAQAYRQHCDAVFRYVRRRVADADVDDVVSEVFLVLARGKAPPTGDGALPWLYAVAYRVVQKHHTRAGQRGRLSQRLNSAHRVPEVADPADQVSSAAWLNKLLGRLSPDDAELLRLVVFEDLTVVSAAAALGISAAAAHTRLHRIRRKVTPWLEGHDATRRSTNHDVPERSR